MAANTNKGFGLLFEMGCGKTRTAIAIAGAAYEKGAIQRVLVIAPTSVVSVWPKEIADVADFKVTCKALLGTKQQRIRMIEDLQAFPFKALKVAVINYESTWRDGLFEKLQEYDADLIICDESQRIKTHDAEQSKAIHKLGDQARYKLILSGTPVQNDAKAMAEVKIWPRGQNETGGILLMPMKKNIPKGHPEWSLVKCPICGQECWRPMSRQEIRQKKMQAACTECGLKIESRRNQP